jgi:hypothetical protein
MKLALGVSLIGAFSLIALYAILIGIMVSGWQNSSSQLWSVASDQTIDTMMEVVNSTLDFVEFTARSVPQFDAWAEQGRKDQTPHDPTNLLRAYAAFNEKSIHRLSSFGFLMRANASRPSGAKVSWQIASGFGCLRYMYAFSNNDINPAFYGYCGVSNGSVDFSNRAYTGSDWGLKPQEVLLLDTAAAVDGIFLPIFDLLGAFTLTYEQRIVDEANQPIVTFAELDLTRLSNHISQNIDLLNGRALAYIYESTTQALVAYNTLNATLFDPVNGTRYTIEMLRRRHQLESSSWIATSTQVVRPGLNWTVVVAVPSEDIYGNMNQSIVIASCISLGVLIVLVGVYWISIHFCVRRQLEAKKRGDSPIPYSVFDEVK